jgi:dihydrofolate reductase
MGIEVIVACTPTGGIGFEGDIPWYIKEDFARFRKITRDGNNAVIMGRRTWTSLPHKPLVGRINVVVSSSIIPNPHAINAVSLEDALLKLNAIPEVDRVFVIGGARLYDEALMHPQCTDVHLTLVENNNVVTDTHFDLSRVFERFEIQDCSATYSDGDISYRFIHYIKN